MKRLFEQVLREQGLTELLDKLVKTTKKYGYTCGEKGKKAFRKDFDFLLNEKPEILDDDGHIDEFYPWFFEEVAECEYNEKDCFQKEAAEDVYYTLKDGLNKLRHK
jgi:hypothetical protein